MIQELLNVPSNQTVVLALATALGATGVFPSPPAKLLALFDNEMMRWLCFFVLLWQGGCGQDTEFAIKMTVVCFVIYLMFENMN